MAETEKTGISATVVKARRKDKKYPKSKFFLLSFHGDGHKLTINVSVHTYENTASNILRQSTTSSSLNIALKYSRYMDIYTTVEYKTVGSYVDNDK